MIRNYLITPFASSRCRWWGLLGVLHKLHYSVLLPQRRVLKALLTILKVDHCRETLGNRILTTG